MDSSSDFYFHQKSNLGFLAEEDFEEGAGSGDDNINLDDSNNCSSDSSSGVASSIASDSSMEEIVGEEEEVTSSSSSSSSSNGPLQDMSSLLQQLPFKRGLSKHYQGKSQSFTSLTNVVCLEDLVKPENPYNKKLKCCRSYACGLSDQGGRSSPPSRIISKKGSRGWGSGFRPPMPPHRSSSTTTISNQTALFA